MRIWKCAALIAFLSLTGLGAQDRSWGLRVPDVPKPVSGCCLDVLQVVPDRSYTVRWEGLADITVEKSTLDCDEAFGALIGRQTTRSFVDLGPVESSRGDVIGRVGSIDDVLTGVSVVCSADGKRAINVVAVPATREPLKVTTMAMLLGDYASVHVQFADWAPRRFASMAQPVDAAELSRLRRNAATGNGRTAGPSSAARVLIGNWVSSQSLTMRGGSFPNWADGSMLQLPSFTDPNPPRVSAYHIRADGTYSYAFGQNQTVYTSHSGRFTVTAATDEAARRYPLLITFMPDRSTYKVFHALDAMPEPLKGMGTAERTYRVRTVGRELRFILADESSWLNDIGSFGVYPMP